jgi:hypothetical protein
VDAGAKTNTAVFDGKPPKYTSNANRVEVRGSGLKKFSPGRSATFNVDCSKAG